MLIDPLFSLQSPSSARDKKTKTGGDLLTDSARGRGGEREENRRALAVVFEKNEKKNKATSVYKLQLSRPGVDLIRAHIISLVTSHLTYEPRTLAHGKGGNCSVNSKLMRDNLPMYFT